MAKAVTNYDLYADIRKDVGLHPKFHTSTGIAHELYRWFGPSPMLAPLNLRINNRQLMIEQHVNILGQNPDKRKTKNKIGELKHFMRNLDRKFKAESND